MDLFRSQPNLCSLFLSLLEEWGADTLDWSLLRDEVFVDRFLRRLLVSTQVDDASIFLASSSLLQPSVGGLLVAPLLERGGHFEDGEMDNFVQFAVRMNASAFDPISWPELLTVLEEVAFLRDEPARFLCSMAANHWVPQSLQGRYTRRIWETSSLTMREKNFYFAWLAGESRWAEVPSPDHQARELLKLRTAGPIRGSNPFLARRRGISPAGKEAHG